jgi:hypothetical protein
MIVSIVLRRRARTELMKSNRVVTGQVARATDASIDVSGGTDLR